MAAFQNLELETWPLSGISALSRLPFALPLSLPSLPFLPEHLGKERFPGGCGGHHLALQEGPN